MLVIYTFPEDFWSKAYECGKAKCVADTRSKYRCPHWIDRADSRTKPKYGSLKASGNRPNQCKRITHNLIFLAENPAPVIEKSLTEPENITYTEFRVLDAYLINALSLWEAQFFLYQAGLVDSIDWKTKVEQDASWYFGNKFAKKWWENAGKDVFEKEFADHVDQVLRNMSDDESYEFWLNSQIISPPSKE